MTIQLDVLSRRLSNSNARFIFIIIPVVIFIGVYSFYADHSESSKPVERVMGEPMKENLPPLKTFKSTDLLPLKDSDKSKNKDKLKLQLTSAEVASNIGREDGEKDEEKPKDDEGIVKEDKDEYHPKKDSDTDKKGKEDKNSKDNFESKKNSGLSDGDAKEEFHPKDLSGLTAANIGKLSPEKKSEKDLEEDEENENKEEDTEKTDAVKTTETEEKPSLFKKSSKESNHKTEEPVSSKFSKKIDEITVEKVVSKVREQLEKIEKEKNKEDIIIRKSDRDIKGHDTFGENKKTKKSKEIVRVTSGEENADETEKTDDDGLVA